MKVTTDKTDFRIASYDLGGSARYDYGKQGL